MAKLKDSFIDFKDPKQFDICHRQISNRVEMRNEEAENWPKKSKKRSQQHPVFQGGQPAKYLMTGLNIAYLQ